jgi:peroxidase
MPSDFAAWRTIDGKGDHPTNPNWGAVGIAQPRLTPSDPSTYEGVGGSGLPSARDISNIGARQAAPSETAEGYSDMLWSWGQFTDHDLDLTPVGDEPAPIAVLPGDAEFDPAFTGTQTIVFHRSSPTSDGEEAGGRNYPNDITSYLDGPMAYGSDTETAAAIRGDGAYLYIDADGFLPKDTSGQYMGGDVRSGENVGLRSLHKLFAREHNRIVDELADRDPDLSTEELFTLARRVIETEIQNIRYDEFLPKNFGEGASGDYQGFDASVDPSIALEFSTAAFRFGHSLLSPEIQRLSVDGSDAAPALALRAAFFNPAALVDGGGIDTVLRGLADGKSEALDTAILEDVRSFLFGPPGAGGFDLAALNIQRGRDHALSSYNDMRAALGLDRKTSFDDFTSDPVIAAKLEEAYGEVDLVETWVGGLAEDAVGGGLAGELFHVIIRDQFEAICAGDIHWSEANPLPEVAQGIALGGFSEVIIVNTAFDHMHEDAFFAYDRQGGGDDDDRLVGGADRNLLSGGDGDDRLVGRDGDDQLEGGHGEDILNGGGGSDLLIAGDGDDRLYGGADHDELFGEAGGDAFVFESVFGHDAVSDFKAGDTIALHGFSLEDVDITGCGSTTLSVEGYSSVKLIGHSAHEFDADDLVFG